MTHEEKIQKLAEEFAKYVTPRDLFIWGIEAKIIAKYWQIRLWVQDHV